MVKKGSLVQNLCDICLCITSSESFEEVMHKIVKRATEILNVKGSLIRTLDKQAQTLELAAYYGLSETYVQKGPLLLSKSLIDQEALAGNTVIVKNAQKDGRVQYPEMMKKENIHSFITVPLRTEAHTFGILRCYVTEAHRFSEPEIANLEMLAEQAAVAIDSLRARERAAKLAEISRRVNSSLSLSDTLNVTVRSVTEAMKVKACSIRLLDERKHRMEIGAVAGLSETFLEYGPYRIEELPIDQQVLRGEIVYIPQVTKDSRFMLPDVAAKEGIVSALCVPLKAMDRVLGTLRAYTATEYEFTEDEKNFLVTIANQAAIAVNNAIIHDRMHTLFLVSTSLSKSLDVHQTFKTIVEGATKAMNAQGCALLMWDNEQNRFNLAESYGVSKNFLHFMEEEYVNLSRDIRCGEMVIMGHLSRDLEPENHKIVLQEGIQSFINTPLKPKEHLIGVLQIYFAIARDFATDEVEFFNTLANEAAVAIENAKLYEHINKKYTNLVEDIFLWYDGTYRGMEY